MFNSLSIALLFYHGENRLHHTTMRLQEQVALPADQMQRIDVIYVLLALVHLPLDPVAVEISEQVIVVLCSGRVPLPFLDVEVQQGFVAVLLCRLQDLGKVAVEVFDEVVVELLSKEVCYSESAGCRRTTKNYIS
jgi:hypothetical protein